MSVGCAPGPDTEGPALTPGGGTEAQDVEDAPSQAPKDEAEPATIAGAPEREDLPVPEPAPKAAPVTDAEEEPEPGDDADDGNEEPDDPPPAYEKAVAAFNEIKAGDEACEQGDMDTAIRHYEKALKIVPEAPKHRFGYAQLLYWKGLSYVQQSPSAFQKSLETLPGESVSEWLKSPAKLSDGERKELENRSDECRRRGESYFKKALEELTRCDADWGYAVEAVAFAKGIVNVMMDRFAYAVGEFKRVLESKRVSDETRREVKALIDRITEYQKQLGQREKEPEGQEKEDE